MVYYKFNMVGSEKAQLIPCGEGKNLIVPILEEFYISSALTTLLHHLCMRDLFIYHVGWYFELILSTGLNMLR